MRGWILGWGIGAILMGCCAPGPRAEEEAPTPIHAVQGRGSDVRPGRYLVEAVVVGDFQLPRQLRGFFLQEEDADADSDPATSEGLFVFCGDCPVDVSLGQTVRVRGAASDYFGMSQLVAEEVEIVGPPGELPAPVPVRLPLPAENGAFLERYEGMLVHFPQTLVVAETWNLGRFGEVLLAAGERPRQFTHVSAPDASGLVAHRAALARHTILLDDDDNVQNSALVHGEPVFHPRPGFSTASYLRGGDSITGLTGILHWSFSGQSGTDAWRLRPVAGAFEYDFERRNPRPPEPPDVGGRLRVASLNVSNYFTTLDRGGDVCGPTRSLECRGADAPEELARQTAKLAAALCPLDAAVIGLVEIENDDRRSLVALTSALDAAGCGPYDSIDTGATGTDAIRVGLAYRPGAVRPVGAPAVLDDPAFTDPTGTGRQRNRPAVAQTFAELSSGERFTAALGHFKSKGSPCGPGDDDVETGQGNCSVTRSRAAAALVQWLASEPTGAGTGKVLVLGDLNAYRNEDPVAVFERSGYTDLIDAFSGEDAYTFVFDGQLGYLDHALASASLLPYVTGAGVWHINADEASLLDYDDAVRDAGEAFFEVKPDALPLYAPDAFRSSDHDPVVVGLELDPPRSGVNRRSW